MAKLWKFAVIVASNPVHIWAMKMQPHQSIIFRMLASLYHTGSKLFSAALMMAEGG
jgi:hypothetical protein